MMFSLKKVKISQQEKEEKVENMLRRFHLETEKEKSPFVLSQGQKRRLSVASMLLTDQQILFLDEPTYGQDYENRLELMNDMEMLRREGVTIIMITHDMHLMLEYTPRALVFSDGQLIADCRASQVLRDPSLVARAALKETSLFTLANRCEITPPESFVDRFIHEDREVRSHGR